MRLYWYGLYFFGLLFWFFGYCASCKRDLDIDKFEAGYKKCSQCLKHSRDYISRHKDKINEEQRKRYEEDEEYRNNFKERNRKWKSKIIVCEVCNCSIRQRGFSEHKLTKKHQQNLENQ